MVTVVDSVPSKSVVKEVVFKKCGVTLQYVPNDVKRDYTSDYTGDRDYFNYITCPNCSKKVVVK